MFTQRNRLLLAKVETTAGQDANPTVSSDAILVCDLNLAYSGDALERNCHRSTLSPEGIVVGKHWAEVKFSVELKGSGSAGTAPQLSPLLQACGFSETIDAGVSVTYKPTSSDLKTITIYVYDLSSESGNVLLHKITGAVGDVEFNFEAGQRGMLNFTFKGKYNAVTDVSAPGTPTFESTLPPIVESASFTLNSSTDLIIQKIDFKMGNEIGDRDDINSPSGLLGFRITDRKPTGSFNPEKVLVATYDFYSDWVNSTKRELSMVIGSSAGNKITISAPKVQLESITDGEKNGVLTNEIPFRLSADSGDDELQLVFE